MELKLSIIMASFLGEYQNSAKDRIKKFHRAVNSFINQTYSNKELIIISDGCEVTQNEYNKHYINNPNIRLLVSEKQPIFSGKIRDIGCRSASGDIISYLDSVTGDRCVPVKIMDKIDIIRMEDLFEKFKFLSYYNGEKEVIDIPNSINIYTLTPDVVTKCDYKTASTLFNNSFNKNQLDIISMLNKGMSIADIARYKNVSYGCIRSSKKIIDKYMEREFYHVGGKWTRITKLIRHFVNKETYKITQKLGQTEITKDHSLIDIINGKFQEVDFNQFKEKGLCTISTIPINKINKFQLSDYINCSSFDLTDGNINYIGKDERHFINNKYESENKMFSLMRILGFYVAEGSSSSRTVSRTWSLDNKKIELLKLLQQDIKNISDVYTTIKKINKGKHDPVYKLVTYNKLFTSIFPELCGKNARNKKIPSFIFSLEHKYIHEFLKFMYWGDGGISKKNWHYTTISLKLISGLSFLLKIIDVDHTFIYRKSKKAWAIIERKDVVIRRKPKTYKIEVDKNPKFVYDIQVEDKNHIFVDACGCVLLHNTDDIIGENHIYSIVKGFEYYKEANIDWVYFNDYIRYNHLSHIPPTVRDIKLEKGLAGTSCIAHSNNQFINWIGCDGYGHDWTFIDRLIKLFPRYRKIDGCSYIVHHIPNSVDL